MSRGFAFSHVLLCKIFNVHCGSTSEIFSVAQKGRKQVSTCGHKFSMLENVLSHGLSLVGACLPKPCSSVALVSAQKRRVALHSLLHPGVGIYYFHRRSNMAEMKSPNAHAKKNRNDTPRKRKTHIIKVRVTAEEKLRIAYACKELHLTQSELVRRVLYGVNVKHTVVVAQGRRGCTGGACRLVCPVQQGRQQPQPACTALQLRRQRHRAAPGANSGGTVRTHELSAESRRNGW